MKPLSDKDIDLVNKLLKEGIACDKYFIHGHVVHVCCNRMSGKKRSPSVNFNTAFGQNSILASHLVQTERSDVISDIVQNSHLTLSRIHESDLIQNLYSAMKVTFPHQSSFVHLRGNPNYFSYEPTSILGVKHELRRLLGQSRVQVPLNYCISPPRQVNMSSSALLPNSNHYQLVNNYANERSSTTSITTLVGSSSPHLFPKGFPSMSMRCSSSSSSTLNNNNLNNNNQFVDNNTLHNNGNGNLSNLSSSNDNNNNNNNNNHTTNNQLLPSSSAHITTTNGNSLLNTRRPPPMLLSQQQQPSASATVDLRPTAEIVILDSIDLDDDSPTYGSSSLPANSLRLPEKHRNSSETMKKSNDAEIEKISVASNNTLYPPSKRQRTTADINHSEDVATFNNNKNNNNNNNNLHHALSSVHSSPKIASHPIYNVPISPFRSSSLPTTSCTTSSLSSGPLLDSMNHATTSAKRLKGSSPLMRHLPSALNSSHHHQFNARVGRTISTSSTNASSPSDPVPSNNTMNNGGGVRLNAPSFSGMSSTNGYHSAPPPSATSLSQELIADNNASGNGGTSKTAGQDDGESEGGADESDKRSEENEELKRMKSMFEDYTEDNNKNDNDDDDDDIDLDVVSFLLAHQTDNPKIATLNNPKISSASKSDALSANSHATTSVVFCDVLLDLLYKIALPTVSLKRRESGDATSWRNADVEGSQEVLFFQTSADRFLDSQLEMVIPSSSPVFQHQTMNNNINNNNNNNAIHHNNNGSKISSNVTYQGTSSFSPKRSNNLVNSNLSHSNSDYNATNNNGTITANEGFPSSTSIAGQIGSSPKLIDGPIVYEDTLTPLLLPEAPFNCNVKKRQRRQPNNHASTAHVQPLPDASSNLHKSVGSSSHHAAASNTSTVPASNKCSSLLSPFVSHVSCRETELASMLEQRYDPSSVPSRPSPLFNPHSSSKSGHIPQNIMSSLVKSFFNNNNSNGEQSVSGCEPVSPPFNHVASSTSPNVMPSVKSPLSPSQPSAQLYALSPAPLACPVYFIFNIVRKTITAVSLSVFDVLPSNDDTNSVVSGTSTLGASKYRS